MSISQFVAFKSGAMPTSSEWGGSCRDLGFDVEVDETDFTDFSGYLPVRFLGQEKGFEFYLSVAADHADLHESVVKHDLVVELVTFSDEVEAQCALVCAAALLVHTGGLYLDSEGGLCDDPQILVGQARDWIGS